MLKLIITGCVLFFISSCGSSGKSGSSKSRIIVIDDGNGVSTTLPAKPAQSTVNKESKSYSALQVKYAKYVHASPEEIKNIKLYSFIDEWLHTPYLWGGTSKNGIDCSAFVQRLLGTVYQININIPRTSIEQFLTDWIERFWSMDALSEGDLIFFSTDKNKLISHIGLYLKNGMFVNSSSSKGVSIANLNDNYWKRCYVASGRIKPSLRGNARNN